jgi:HEAT repeat protein
VRIAAANALDTLGPAVAPAATQLVAALRDCNLFVRWITARSLSNIGPGKLPPALEETIVLALGEATRCGDEDARRVALKALERFGAKAVPAIPLLGPAIENDNAEVQTQALKALDVIGPAGKAALPFLLKALQSPEARVRRQVPAIIAKYGPDAKSAIPALEVALFDSDEIVRQEAAKALLKLQK